MSDGDAQYTLELSTQGMKVLLGELIANIDADVINSILERLVGLNWKKL